MAPPISHFSFLLTNDWPEETPSTDPLWRLSSYLGRTAAAWTYCYTPWASSLLPNLILKPGAYAFGHQLLEKVSYSNQHLPADELQKNIDRADQCFKDALKASRQSSDGPADYNKLVFAHALIDTNQSPQITSVKPLDPFYDIYDETPSIPTALANSHLTYIAEQTQKTLADCKQSISAIRSEEKKALEQSDEELPSTLGEILESLRHFPIPLNNSRLMEVQNFQPSDLKKLKNQKQVILEVGNFICDADSQRIKSKWGTNKELYPFAQKIILKLIEGDRTLRFHESKKPFLKALDKYEKALGDLEKGLQHKSALERNKTLPQALEEISESLGEMTTSKNLPLALLSPRASDMLNISHKALAVLFYLFSASGSIRERNAGWIALQDDLSDKQLQEQEERRMAAYNDYDCAQAILSKLDAGKLPHKILQGLKSSSYPTLTPSEVQNTVTNEFKKRKEAILDTVQKGSMGLEVSSFIHENQDDKDPKVHILFGDKAYNREGAFPKSAQYEEASTHYNTALRRALALSGDDAEKYNIKDKEKDLILFRSFKASTRAIIAQAVEKAIQYEKAGKLDEALSYYETAVRNEELLCDKADNFRMSRILAYFKAPENYKIMFKKGAQVADTSSNAYTRTEHSEKVLKELNRLLKKYWKDYDDEQLAQRLTSMLPNSMDPTTAKDRFKRVITWAKKELESEPNNLMQLQTKLGELYYVQGKHSKGLKHQGLAAGASHYKNRKEFDLPETLSLHQIPKDRKPSMWGGGYSSSARKPEEVDFCEQALTGINHTQLTPPTQQQAGRNPVGGGVNRDNNVPDL